MSNLPLRVPGAASLRRVASVLSSVVALLAVACSPASPPRTASPSSGSAAPSGSSGPAATAQPTTGAIEHSTAATDVILRIETGGGFVPIDFLATQAPTFSLFGDGVVVFQPKVQEVPQPDADGIVKGVPWRTATLDEGQIQELLDFALGTGGMGAARETYIEGGIADAPSTIFTVHAGGIDKTVTVNALSEEARPGPDSQARSAFWKLAARLQDFDQGGRIATDVYAPDRFRGVLIEREAQPGVTPLAWPWADIPFGDFKEGPPDGSGSTRFPHRTILSAETAALKLDGLEGGVQGIAIKAPNGRVYGLVLRPLLADETE